MKNSCIILIKQIVKELSSLIKIEEEKKKAILSVQAEKLQELAEKTEIHLKQLNNNLQEQKKMMKTNSNNMSMPWKNLKDWIDYEKQKNLEAIQKNNEIQFSKEEIALLEEWAEKCQEKSHILEEKVELNRTLMLNANQNLQNLFLYFKKHFDKENTSHTYQENNSEVKGKKEYQKTESSSSPLFLDMNF